MMECRHAGAYVAAMVMIVWTVACNAPVAPDEPLIVDVHYSESLSVLSKQFKFAARANAAATVQVVQLYGPGAQDVASLRDATRGQLLYESRTPSEIASLFESLQSHGTPGTCNLGSDPALVLVAYDRDLPRVGVIRLYECSSDGGAVIGVRPLGDAGLDYSSAAVTYLHAIGVL